LNINSDGTVVYDLLGAKIGPDRLDEADIIAVKVWAEILSNNVDVENKEALNVSIKLCNLILGNYYPEDLDANRILYDVYERLVNKKEEEIQELEKLQKKEEIQKKELIQKKEEVQKKELIQKKEEVHKKKEVYRQAINSSINNWLVQDPIYYAALIWARDFSDEGQFKDSLNRAIKLKPDEGSYYFMLGNYYHVKGNYQEAIEPYKKALRADPTNANYFNTLGNAYFVQSDYPNAIENYQRAVNQTLTKHAAS
jgi:tetratricopeptide (TPR) repeat protein